MSFALLIATSFSIGFFIESMIGFGGGIIAYSILSFFTDFKEMVLAGLYIGTLSSSHIFLSDRKSFDKETFKNLIPICLIGTILGVMVFSNFSAKILSAILGIILILLAIKTIFFDKFTFPKIFKNKLLLLGGISQGAFGIGGPFVINAVKKDFKTKSNLRTTMAAYFVSFNLIRIIQLSLAGNIDFSFFAKIWWTIIPVFIAIKCGHLLHVKISENFVKKAIAIITIFAGLEFLTK